MTDGRLHYPREGGEHSTVVCTRSLTWHVLALRGRRCRVDRCALFVDAGYVLADGAMAVHGTRRRESVSWDYAGLLQLFGNLAMERTRLPLLRCYWYEATVEGRRSADHDTLADLPGVKLRVAKMRPGRREGVEGEIHRDLTTLARNKAVSDVMVVSAEEDLAQVIADVQDMGMRVTLLHIATDGDWTISRALRQECDDIVEISAAHLRPYVELISGAEPPRPDESEAGRAAPGHERRVNGNGTQRERQRDGAERPHARTRSRGRPGTGTAGRRSAEPQSAAARAQPRRSRAGRRRAGRDGRRAGRARPARAPWPPTSAPTWTTPRRWTTARPRTTRPPPTSGPRADVGSRPLTTAPPWTTARRGLRARDYRRAPAGRRSPGRRARTSTPRRSPSRRGRQATATGTGAPAGPAPRRRPRRLQRPAPSGTSTSATAAPARRLADSGDRLQPVPVAVPATARRRSGGCPPAARAGRAEPGPAAAGLPPCRARRPRQAARARPAGSRRAASRRAAGRPCPLPPEQPRRRGTAAGRGGSHRRARAMCSRARAARLRRAAPGGPRGPVSPPPAARARRPGRPAAGPGRLPLAAPGPGCSRRSAAPSGPIGLVGPGGYPGGAPGVSLGGRGAVGPRGGAGIRRVGGARRPGALARGRPGAEAPDALGP